jgi:hypothetical protein
MIRPRLLSILLLTAAACGGSGSSKDAPGDGGDAAPETGGDQREAPDDTGADAADAAVATDAGDATVAATCEGAAAVSVCGCGCCGGVAMSAVCYFPALGQTASAIPDPRPANCATVGCSAGVRHVCCADPGPAPAGADAGNASYCARDPGTNLPRIQVTKTDGATCTTISLQGPGAGGAAVPQPIAGWTFENGTRGPCAGSATPTYAIGALGSVALRATPAPGHVDVHLAVFFDAASGVPDAIRFDVADLTLSVSSCAP